MGLVLSAMTLALLGAFLFVPIFVVALAMRLPPLRALVLAMFFTLGAVAGAMIASWLGTMLISREPSRTVQDTLAMLFMVAGAAAGGAIALWGLARLSKTPPWRRN